MIKSRFYSFSFILTLWLTWWSGILNPSALPWFLKNHPTAPVNELSNFDPISSALYTNRIDYALLFGEIPEGSFTTNFKEDPRSLNVANLERYNPAWTPNHEDFQDASRIGVYHSQTALLADAYARIALTMQLPRDATFSVLKAITALLAALVMLPLWHLIRRMWGEIAGFVLWGFLLLSIGFNLFTTSLYWSIYLSVLPTTITAIVAHRIMQDRCSLSTYLSMAAALYLVVSFKFLVGLEFASIILLMPFAPLAMIAFSPQTTTKKILHASIVAAAAMSLGIITALIIFNFIHHHEFGKSGIEYLLSRAEEWKTGNQITHIRSRDPMRLLVPLWVGARYWGLPMLVPFACGLAAFLFAPYILLKSHYSAQQKSMAAASVVAFIAAMSWVILQYEHIVWHPSFATFWIALPLSCFCLPAVVVFCLSEWQRKKLAVAREGVKNNHI